MIGDNITNFNPILIIPNSRFSASQNPEVHLLLTSHNYCKKNLVLLPKSADISERKPILDK